MLIRRLLNRIPNTCFNTNGNNVQNNLLEYEKGQCVRMVSFQSGISKYMSTIKSNNNNNIKNKNPNTTNTNANKSLTPPPSPPTPLPTLLTSRIRIGRPTTSLKMGLLGMANIGKSSTFNLITNLNVPCQNVPFCTIEPNMATIDIYQEEQEVSQGAQGIPKIDNKQNKQKTQNKQNNKPNIFKRLVQYYNPQSVIPPQMRVVDIAGLVRGASEGYGLGNQFLSNLTVVDGLYHVVRAFHNKDIPHTQGSMNSVRDIRIIKNQLIFKDLEGAMKKLKDISRKVGVKNIQECFSSISNSNNANIGNNCQLGAQVGSAKINLNRPQYTLMVGMNRKNYYIDLHFKLMSLISLFHSIMLNQLPSLDYSIPNAPAPSNKNIPSSTRLQYEVLFKVVDCLKRGIQIRNITEWKPQQVQQVLNRHLFLTAKPVVYLINMSMEDYLRRGVQGQNRNQITPTINNYNPTSQFDIRPIEQQVTCNGRFSQSNSIILYSVQYQNHIRGVQNNYQLNIGGGGINHNNINNTNSQTNTPNPSNPTHKSAIPSIIKSGLHALQLSYFYTVGTDQVRAWPIRYDDTAIQAASKIHTDFKDSFISADVIAGTQLINVLEEYKKNNSNSNKYNVNNANIKWRKESKTYVVNKGDVMHFNCKKKVAKK